MGPQWAGEPWGPLLSPLRCGGRLLTLALLIGTELWHAQYTSGPGSCCPALAACIQCPHPQHAAARHHPGWCSWMWRELIEHRPEAALISTKTWGKGCPDTAVAFPRPVGDARRDGRLPPAQLQAWGAGGTAGSSAVPAGAFSWEETCSWAGK